MNATVIDSSILKTYETDVHGQGLYESGLLATAVCGDCHGAHAIHPVSDEQSTVHVAKISAMCATCHRFIEERIARSVHAPANGPGGKTEMATGEAMNRQPSCMDLFNTHMRPDKFPMDKSVLTGLVSEHELREERPEYLERLRRNGELHQRRADAPSRKVLWLASLGGTVALAVGVGLLAGIVLAAIEH
jgi:hypothetical protein